MIWLAALWIAWADPAPDVLEDSADGERNAPSSGAAEPPSPSDSLSRARDAYFSGEHERALAEFAALAADEQPVEIRLEAMLWLGEVQFVLGDEVGARATFRTLLMLDPEYPISAYEHPLEVVGAFEVVRRAVREQAPSPARPRPYPAWGYLPMGAPQFGQGQRGRGAMWTTLQLGFGAASVGTYVYLSQLPAWKPVNMDDADVPAHAQTVRYAVQIPATAVFYGLWLGSVIDGRRAWNTARISASPLPGGGLVGLEWPLGGRPARGGRSRVAAEWRGDAGPER